MLFSQLKKYLGEQRTYIHILFKRVLTITAANDRVAQTRRIKRSGNILHFLKLLEPNYMTKVVKNTAVFPHTLHRVLSDPMHDCFLNFHVRFSA